MEGGHTWVNVIDPKVVIFLKGMSLIILDHPFIPLVRLNSTLKMQAPYLNKHLIATSRTSLARLGQHCLYQPASKNRKRLIANDCFWPKAVTPKNRI